MYLVAADFQFRCSIVVLECSKFQAFVLEHKGGLENKEEKVQNPPVIFRVSAFKIAILFGIFLYISTNY